MQIQFISHKQVLKAIGHQPGLVKEWTAEILRLHRQRQTVLTPKTYLNVGHVPKGQVDYSRLITSPGAIQSTDFNAVGVKILGSHPYNYAKGLPGAKSYVMLADPLTNIPSTVVDGSFISTTRTFAYTQMMFDKMLRPGSSVGVVGMGALGKMHARELGTLYPDISKIVVYSEHAPLKGLDAFPKVEISKSGLSAVFNCDVVVTTSGASTAYMHTVQPNTYLLHCLSGTDFGEQVVRNAEQVVIDDPKISIASGKFYVPWLEQYAQQKPLTHLIDFTTPNLKAGQYIYTNPIGLPILDIGIAARVVEMVKSGSFRQRTWHFFSQLVKRV